MYKKSGRGKRGSQDSMAPAPRTYLGRFYILAVAAFLALHQNTTWITFSTIPQQAKDEFDLSDDQITILAGISTM